MHRFRSYSRCFHLAPIERLEHAIARAGFTPVQRNSWYGIVDPRQEPSGPMSREEAATRPAAARPAEESIE